MPVLHGLCDALPIDAIGPLTGAQGQPIAVLGRRTRWTIARVTVAGRSEERLRSTYATALAALVRGSFREVPQGAVDLERLTAR